MAPHRHSARLTVDGGQVQRPNDLPTTCHRRAAAQRATELVTHHRAELDSLTRRLLEEETVDGSVVHDLLLHPDGAAEPTQLVPGE
jgi:cell division protease FtsH